MTATKPLNTNVGIELLHDPRQNKSTAFTLAERQELGLIGLLPSGVDTEDIQVRRALQQIGDKPTDLERYIYLVGLLDTDETLFYKVAMSDPARFLPVLYDPTVGEACLKFGHIFRRPRGMYLSLKDKGNVRAVLKNWPEKDVRVICITSGERILGLGDLGTNGMGIPIGKLQLYTACAGVPPQYLLPMHLDFGTNNHELLNDPLYLGLRQPRVSITERDELVDEFVRAVQEVFPGCCIHFEDWAGVDAERLLKRYRDKVSCYNDDIQGTAGVALAGILNALRVTGGKLRDQRILSWRRIGRNRYRRSDRVRNDAGWPDPRPGAISYLALRHQGLARTESQRLVRFPGAIRPSARALDGFRLGDRGSQTDRDYWRQYQGIDVH